MEDVRKQMLLDFMMKHVTRVYFIVFLFYIELHTVGPAVFPLFIEFDCAND